MKTITRLLVLMLALACLFTTPSAFAGEQFLLDDEGKVFVGEKPKRIPNLAEQEAYKYPGKKIALYGPPVIERVHFFEGVEVQKSSEYLIFDSLEGKIKRGKEDAVFRGEKRFLWYLVMVGIVLIVMIVGEIFLYKQGRFEHVLVSMLAYIITSGYVINFYDHPLDNQFDTGALLAQTFVCYPLVRNIPLPARWVMRILFCILSVVILVP